MNIGHLLRVTELIYRGQFKYLKFNGKIYSKDNIPFTDTEFDILMKQHKDDYLKARAEMPSTQNRLMAKHPIACGTCKKYTPKTEAALIKRLAQS